EAVVVRRTTPCRILSLTRVRSDVYRLRQKVRRKSVALRFQVLGGPCRDNALLVRIDSGQGVSRLLFDCGDGCLWDLPFGEVQAIDHLFFSHLHMDHIGGFDTFFRSPFGRTGKVNHVWGPPRTAEVLHHRFRGCLWNMRQGWEARWL